MRIFLERHQQATRSSLFRYFVRGTVAAAVELAHAGLRLLSLAETHSCVALLPVGAQISRSAAKPVPYETNSKMLGQHLLKERKARGLHQREAAEVIGVKASTYGNWETGRTSPTIRFWPAVMDFRVPVCAGNASRRATA